VKRRPPSDLAFFTHAERFLEHVQGLTAWQVGVLMTWALEVSIEEPGPFPEPLDQIFFCRRDRLDA
jgi:hypothetical protein